MPRYVHVNDGVDVVLLTAIATKFYILFKTCCCNEVNNGPRNLAFFQKCAVKFYTFRREMCCALFNGLHC